VEAGSGLEGWKGEIAGSRVSVGIGLDWAENGILMTPKVSAQ
jgi:hypothetical protein